MATDKKHIAVYLDKENEKSLEGYIEQHGGIKYSAAVNQILSVFFGHAPSSVPGNIPVTEELEATIKKLLEEQIGKLPSNTPSNVPSDEVLERLSNLEKKLEELSNRPETIPGILLEQEVVEPEHTPGIIPGEMPSISLGVAKTSRQQVVNLNEFLRQTVESFSKNKPKTEEAHKISNSDYESLNAANRQYIEGMKSEAIVTPANDEPDPETIPGIVDPSSDGAASIPDAQVGAENEALGQRVNVLLADNEVLQREVMSLREAATALKTKPETTKSKIIDVKAIAIDTPDPDETPLPKTSEGEVQPDTREPSAVTGDNQETVEPEAVEAIADDPKPTTQFSNGLTGAALAQRLGKDAGTITRHHQKGDLPDWSKELDPDGISWERRGKLYFLVSTDSAE